MISARGYSLVEALMVVAIGAGVVAGGVAFLSTNADFQAHSRAMSESEFLRTRIFDALGSDKAWENTLNAAINSTSMACLKNGTNCSAMGSGSQSFLFALYDDNNNLIFDSTSRMNGFTPSGALCNNFSLERGSDSCPFRFDIAWTPDCVAGDCTNPLILISARLVYSPLVKEKPLNPDRYSILNYYRENVTSDPICQALSHAANRKTFNVSWTPGSRNGGAGGCTIQYQRNDLSWVDLASVNCDAAGSAAGTITLPNDGWTGGGWSNQVNVRLVRNSDSTVLCSLGRLTCRSMGQSNSPTPLIDEDCNGQWDNAAAASTCSGSASISRSGGDSYTCPEPLVRPCGSLVFARSVVFQARVNAFSSSSCSPATLVSAAPSAVHASLGTASGTVPTSGTWMWGGTSGVLTVLMGSTACQGQSPVWVRLADEDWETASCQYYSTSSPGGYF